MPETGWLPVFHAAAAFVAVLVSFLGIAVTDAALPMKQPGTTWSRGMLSGQTLRLFDSGRYALTTFCDICLDEPPELGTWSRDADRIVLRPQVRGRPLFVLEVRTIGTCEALIEERGIAEPNPFDVFIRYGDDCDPLESVGDGPDCRSSPDAAQRNPGAICTEPSGLRPRAFIRASES